MKIFLTIFAVIGLGSFLFYHPKKPIPHPVVQDNLPPLVVLEEDYIPSDPHDMLPWKSEKLSQPIYLPNCSGVKIIEWRGSSPTPESIKLIDRLCYRAINNLQRFLQSEGIHLNERLNFSQDLCLIPSDSKVRNLNDSFFRFKYRQRINDDEDKKYTLLGYTSYPNRTIFIGSEINSKFITTMAHEMYHALSWHHQIYRQYRGHVMKTDEAMAVKFSKYLEKL